MSFSYKDKKNDPSRHGLSQSAAGLDWLYFVRFRKFMHHLRPHRMDGVPTFHNLPSTTFFRYNEPQLVGEIEEHLGVSIPEIGTDLNVPLDEFDGKVVYGAKRKLGGAGLYKGHVEQLAPTVKDLALMEQQSQSKYISYKFLGIMNYVNKTT